MAEIVANAELDAPCLSRHGPYIVKVASSSQEREEVLRLRYKVFALELGEANRNQSGLEQDAFDDDCIYVCLVMRQTREIVGCYRLLFHHNVDSEKMISSMEFDLSRISGYSVVELGRLAVRKDHRRSMALILLLLGVMKYIQQRNVDYVCGLVSMPKSMSASKVWGVYALMQQRRLVDNLVLPRTPSEQRVRYKGYYGKEPNPELRNVPDTVVDPPPDAIDGRISPDSLKLLNTYIAMGARVVSKPAFDVDFGCYDFFCMGPMRTWRLSLFLQMLKVKLLVSRL